VDANIVIIVYERESRIRACAQESGASKEHCLRFIAYAPLRNRDVAATGYDAAAREPPIPNHEGTRAETPQMRESESRGRDSLQLGEKGIMESLIVPLDYGCTFQR